MPLFELYIIHIKFCANQCHLLFDVVINVTSKYTCRELDS